MPLRPKVLSTRKVIPVSDKYMSLSAHDRRDRRATHTIKTLDIFVLSYNHERTMLSMGVVLQSDRQKTLFMH